MDEASIKFIMEAYASTIDRLLGRLDKLKNRLDKLETTVYHANAVGERRLEVIEKRLGQLEIDMYKKSDEAEMMKESFARWLKGTELKGTRNDEGDSEHEHWKATHLG